MDAYEAIMPKLWKRTEISILRALNEWKRGLRASRGQERKELKADIAYGENMLKGVRERLSSPLKSPFPSGSFRPYSILLEEREREKAQEKELEKEEKMRQAEADFQRERQEAVEAGEKPPPRRLRRKGRRHISGLAFLGGM